MTRVVELNFPLQILVGDWADQALCKGMDVSHFFPEASVSRQYYKKAKEICEACPVVNECKNFALENEIAHGFWGGLNPTERKGMMSIAKRMKPESLEIALKVFRFVDDLKKQGTENYIDLAAEHFGLTRSSIFRRLRHHQDFVRITELRGEL